MIIEKAVKNKKLFEKEKNVLERHAKDLRKAWSGNPNEVQFIIESCDERSDLKIMFNDAILTYELVDAIDSLSADDLDYEVDEEATADMNDTINEIVEKIELISGKKELSEVTKTLVKNNEKELVAAFKDAAKTGTGMIKLTCKDGDMTYKHVIPEGPENERNL